MVPKQTTMFASRISPNPGLATWLAWRRSAKAARLLPSLPILRPLQESFLTANAGPGDYYDGMEALDLLPSPKQTILHILQDATQQGFIEEGILTLPNDLDHLDYQTSMKAKFDEEIPLGPNSPPPRLRRLNQLRLRTPPARNDPYQYQDECNASPSNASNVEVEEPEEGFVEVEGPAVPFQTEAVVEVDEGFVGPMPLVPLGAPANLELVHVPDEAPLNAPVPAKLRKGSQVPEIQESGATKTKEKKKREKGATPKQNQKKEQKKNDKKVQKKKKGSKEKQVQKNKGNGKSKVKSDVEKKLHSVFWLDQFSQVAYCSGVATSEVYSSAWSKAKKQGRIDTAAEEAHKARIEQLDL